MKRNRWLAIATTMVLIFTITSADARRLGGGRSIGKQSPNVTQSQAAPCLWLRIGNPVLF